MKKPVFFVVALVLVTCFANAQDTPNAYFYSGTERVNVTVRDDLVAIRFSTDPDQSLMDSVTDIDALEGLLEERLQPFTDHGVMVYRTADRSKKNPAYIETIIEVMSEQVARMDDIADIGAIVVMPTGAMAVMTDRLSVGFREGVSGVDEIPELSRLVRDARVLNEEPLVVAYRAAPESGLNALEVANAIQEFQDGRLVTYAVATLRFARELRSNDPKFPEQWHLDSEDFAHIDALKAWDYTRGSMDMPVPGGCVVNDRVRIAVFDNGVETDHEDLADNMSANGKDYTVSPVGNDPDPDPGDAHGTRAAGVIAACGDNGIGVSGVCPLCQIVPIKIDPHVSEKVIDALYDVHNGIIEADIVSNSWGDGEGNGVMPDFQQALNIISGTFPLSDGIPVFFAVQNDESNRCTGLNRDISAEVSVIAVGMSTILDEHEPVSGYGPCLDLVAPSQQGTDMLIITTDLNTDLNDGYTTRTGGFGGTSSATATVAGIAGLVLSLNRNLSQLEVRQILQHTAEEIEVPFGAEFNNGYSPRAGYGRVNAHRAVVPIVKISVTTDDGNTDEFGVDKTVSVDLDEEFSVIVSASAPYGVSQIGWSGYGEHWRNVGGDAFMQESWTNQAIGVTGIYTLRPSARDSIFPGTTADPNYPHQATETGLLIPTVTIEVGCKEGFLARFKCLYHGFGIWARSLTLSSWKFF